jgi:ABC-type sugar transport system substrate-binding protein
MFARIITDVAMAIHRLIPFSTRRYSMLTRLMSTGVAMAMLAVAPAMAQQKVTIGVSLASDTNPFYIAMKSGILARAKELGVSVTFVTANENPRRTRTSRRRSTACRT